MSKSFGAAGSTMLTTSQGKPFVVWLTGLSGSGKTTLAKKLHARLKTKRLKSVIVDGDEVRKTISKDLEFSKRDIAENHRRIRKLCKERLQAGYIVIVAVISPQAKTRAMARRELKPFVEIYCSAPLAVCAKRDVKGHYRNARAGKVKNFIGIDTTYEPPEHPDITLHTHKETATQSIKKVIDSLEERRLII